MDGKASLLAQLLSAFPRTQATRKHEDIVLTRSRLSLYQDVDFPKALGEVIEDSILCYPDTADIEETVRFLDATDNVARQFNKRIAFDQLTNVQARVIVAWLRYISGWPELEIYRESINAALPYWSARAQGD